MRHHHLWKASSRLFHKSIESTKKTVLFNLTIVRVPKTKLYLRNIHDARRQSTMVATRARKRRAHDNGDNDQQQSQQQQEDSSSLDLEENSAVTCESSQKKQRRILEDADDSFEEAEEQPQPPLPPPPLPPFEMLPASAIETILSFLNNSRDVYNLCTCAKYIQECITPEIVVRSAVFGEEKTRNVVKMVVDSLDKKSIHVPSAFRLLRLVNGTKCERGDQCFSYDLINKVAGTIVANEAAYFPRFGLLICSTCAKCTSCPWNRASSHSVKQIDATYQKSEEKRQAFDCLFETIDQEALPQDTPRAQAIVEAYYAAQSDYNAFVKAKNERIMKMYGEKESQRRNKRLDNGQKVYAKLKALLSDYDHKDLVLDCTWDENGYGHCNYRPADAIFGGLFRAPSNATKALLAAAVDRACLVIDKIHAYGFVVGAQNFLRVLVLRGGHEHYIKFVVRYLQNLSTTEQEAILNPQENRFADLEDYVRLIEEGKPFDALLHLLIRAAQGDNQCPAGLDHMIFCRRIKARDESQRPKLISLAKKIWCETFRSSRSAEYNTEANFRAKFELCRQQYKTLHASIRAYLSDPLTIAFLGETISRARFGFTRQNAIDTMYTDDECIDHLRSRNFVELLSLHRSFFAFGGLW